MPLEVGICSGNKMKTRDGYSFIFLQHSLFPFFTRFIHATGGDDIPERERTYKKINKNSLQASSSLFFWKAANVFLFNCFRYVFFLQGTVAMNKWAEKKKNVRMIIELECNDKTSISHDRVT